MLKNATKKIAIMTKGFAMALLLSMTVSSCQNEEPVCGNSEESYNKEIGMQKRINKDSLMTDFAILLSKVTYSRQDVREFIKNEAAKGFDRNSDVLYAMAKGKLIGNKTFREILVENSSEEYMKEIENNIPLLNILIPNNILFDITLDNMDCNDADIPVSVAKSGASPIYINGEYEGEIENGEIPGFHLFVINENSRVVIDDSRSVNEEARIRFISSNYDGMRISRAGNSISRADNDTVNASGIDRKMIEAYSYFYKDDGSVNSRSYQRDYIYYGMTPDSQQGSLNRSVSEYLSFIRIPNNVYSTMADQTEDIPNNDPVLAHTKLTKYNKKYTEEALIDAFWKKGVYNIKIEIMCANSNNPQVKYISVRPDQLWDLNPDIEPHKGNLFHRRKYIYRVKPDNFISKKYYPANDNMEISFGKWNLSDEALVRRVKFSEEDVASTITYEESYTMTKLTSTKINGDVKFGLGTNKPSFSVGGETSGSTTETINKVFKLSYTQEDDDLGNADIYFYDPLIVGKNGENYILRSYSTGSVEFGIVVK